MLCTFFKSNIFHTYYVNMAIWIPFFFFFFTWVYLQRWVLKKMKLNSFFLTHWTCHPSLQMAEINKKYEHLWLKLSLQQKVSLYAKWFHGIKREFITNMNTYDQNFHYNKRCLCTQSDFMELRENSSQIWTLMIKPFTITKGVSVCKVISSN
jgi:hypothetical protein